MDNAFHVEECRREIHFWPLLLHNSFNMTEPSRVKRGIKIIAVVIPKGALAGTSPLKPSSAM